MLIANLSAKVIKRLRLLLRFSKMDPDVLNEMIDAINDHEDRITALEP